MKGKLTLKQQQRCRSHLICYGDGMNQVIVMGKTYMNAVVCCNGDGRIMATNNENSDRRHASIALIYMPDGVIFQLNRHATRCQQQQAEKQSLIVYALVHIYAGWAG